MPSLLPGGKRMIVLKYAAGGTTPTVAMPVRLDAGVDLGAVGRVLGIESSSVRLNGHFVSRGLDLVSTLSWESLLSFFATRGHPVGSSLVDAIVVEGKPVVQGWNSSSNVNDGHLFLKRKNTINDTMSPKRCRVLEGSSNMHNVGIEQEIDDVCCIKRQLKLEEELPSKKGKNDKCTLGLLKEASKLSTISAETGSNCSFVNEFGKRLRVDDICNALSSKKVK
ncbi:hypothetical protein HPP92_011779 [Vanilla planifolia]|uniref:Uncharacterized protein n=1 Tax=Vanilla planifolia TaxID=51239 RepID=A0A835QWB8_VANPL|nr:hypothetical protein HPP92_011779 [Vanilla planifolia]